LALCIYQKKNPTIMQKKLKWNAIGLVRKTKLLQEYIKGVKDSIPSDHTSKLSTQKGYLDELNHLLGRMERIEKILIPKLEKFFRLHFPTPELLMFALSRPSIRNIFDDLNTHFRNDSNRPLTEEEMIELASSGDAAEVLALLGDAALDLAVVQLFWDTSLSNTGVLTEIRKSIASNLSLSRYCDEWNLCDYRLNRFKESKAEDITEKKIIHEKGTLVESILGVIYLEFGYEKILEIVSLFQ
jgi:dsRNA-specific ribonuclease